MIYLFNFIFVAILCITRQIAAFYNPYVTPRLVVFGLETIAQYRNSITFVSLPCSS